MTTTILALTSLLLSGCIVFSMRMPLTAGESASLGNLLKTPINRRQPFHADDAIASRQRRSPHQDDSPVDDSKYRAPQGQKYDGNTNEVARGPYDSAIRRPYDFKGSFRSLGVADIPLSERSFDSLGGGELPWLDRRSKGAGAGDLRIQEREFDTLGGGELPWLEGKRSRQRK